MNTLDIKVIPVSSDEDIEECRKAGEQDDHDLSFIDHAVVKNKKIIGTFATVPLVFWWMHSKEAKKMDSLMMFNAMDSIQRENGNIPYLMVCEPDSPYYPLLQKYFQEYVLKDNKKPSIFLQG
tara:strand:- start:390 stop:758 length:369 start_codon:yes stop_codon:yes gene_type:complete